MALVLRGISLALEERILDLVFVNDALIHQ